MRVEIVDYLRVARRRLWVLAGVPVVATGVATAVVLTAPTQFTATAYVAAPALVGSSGQQYSGNQAANQFVAAFAAAATSPKVVGQVTADTGVDAAAIRDGVKVTQIGASSQLELKYTTTRRATATPVAESAARHALAFLFSSQLDIATQQVEAASDDVDTATAAIAEWEKENKLSQPDRTYQATLNELSSLKQQQLSMQAVGNERGAYAAGEAIAAAQKRLDNIGRKLPEYQALLAQRDAATSALARARQGLQDARAQSRAADPDQVIDVGAAREVSRLRNLQRTALPVGAAGVLLAVLLVVGLEVLARNRRTGSHRAGPAS
jgi:uncharacterized protein involved in exopolysaccharide biosynthesis